ncbi:hypothetical protein LOK49_LG01G00896 [Camellia lanceoleosa]|uniref:Uncharacterized protein n=1 Tax=Camellia lanceoleosa TaxID=1840588 RepID=A0ACC0J299_9ERIC|nr:hypothetical protein LOK49_LG01G00896 [Camellia lanceoleosa]
MWTTLSASLESGRPQAKASVEVFGASSHSPGSLVEVSSKLPDLGRVCASFLAGLELRRTYTAMVASQESGLPQANTAVEDFRGSLLSLGSTVTVSPKLLSVLVGDEQCLQDLSCGEECEPKGTADEGCWSSRVDRLALVVQLEVVDAEVDVVDVGVEEGIHSLVVDFHEDVIPSSEEVLRWVLSRINEVSHFLEVSFEGHEHEAFALFSAIEGSWRESALNCQINGPEAVICVVASQIPNLGESVIDASLQEKEGFRWVAEQ